MLLEVALRVFFVDDGVLLGNRPLPPFGATTNGAQRDWVRDWRGRLAAGEDVAGAAEFRMDLGWSMRRSASFADIVTNNLGARGARDYPARPIEGTFRITCFGDSFTWADGVTVAESWPARIETATENVEAINFGVGAYGTDQALLRFRVDGRGLGAHAVLIGIMLEDIGRNVSRYRPWYYPSTPVAYAKPRFRLDGGGSLIEVPLPYADFPEYLHAVANGTVVEDLRDHDHWFDAGTFGSSLVTVRLVSGVFAYLARDHRRAWEDARSEPYRVTQALLRTFHAEALADGATLAPIVVFPALTDLEAKLAEGRSYWAPALDQLREGGLPVIDLADPLAAHCHERRLAAAEIYTGGHLDPSANNLVAEVLLDWLERSRDERSPALNRRY